MLYRYSPFRCCLVQAVYNAVLDAHSSVISAMKPGVSWPVSVPHTLWEQVAALPLHWHCAMDIP